MFDDRRVGIEQYAVSALGGRSWASGISIRASLGAVLGGELEDEGQRHEVGAGVLGGLAVSRQWTRGPWFMTGSFGLSASRTETLLATDGRLGAIAGRTIGIASPYLLARAFGGPVRWTVAGEDLTGSDAHHYQLGAGISVSTASGWSALLDVSALGERGVSLGASLRL